MSKRIVVGVDGSEGSIEALVWAIEEAQVRQWELQAVTAWQSPYDYYYGEMPIVVVSDAEILEQVNKQLDTAIDKATSLSPSLTHIERLIVEGSPAEVLCDLSRSVDLLVVGSRGHGGFAGLLLGSVSTQCAQHSECPVVIVHKHHSRK
ncbi:MAG: universal stress protein [Actinobacteria bacterium]|jgi:nucleotide-binding universal stress UspA family protein|nr:universal stress protein [Actinomycetota bacterium]MCL6095494.1 universal stress protein [Actinomycetota bacterium]